MPVYPMQMDLTTGRALVGPLGSGMIGSGSLTSGMQIPAPVVVSGPLTIVPTAAPGTAALLQVISGVGFQRTATTPRQGLLTFVNTLVSGAVAAISGPGVLVEHYTDLFQVTFTPPAAPGSAFNYATPSFQMGSGGMKAASGYWALSSWVGSGQIGRNHIAALAIGSGSLGNGAVLSANIASGQIGEEHIASGVIVAADLASGAVLSGNIGNAAVVSGSIASGQIGFLHVAALGIGSGNLANGAVLSAAIASGQIAFLHIAALGVGSGNLGNGAVLSANLASGQIANAHVAAGGLLSANIASGQIGVNHLQSGAVQSGGLGNAAIVSGNIASGQIGFLHIAALGIGSGNLGNGAVLSANIASGQVGVNHLQSGAIQSGNLANTAIVSGNLASGQIGNAHLAAGAVLSNSIASGQIGTNHVAENAVLPNVLFSGRVEVITSNFQIFHGTRTLSGLPGVMRLEQAQAPLGNNGGQGGFEQLAYRALATPVLSNKGGLASGDAALGFTAFAFEGSANTYAWLFNQVVVVQNTPISGRHGALYQLRLADLNEAVDQITTVPTTKFQVGSGGSYFTSGFWLLSGGVGSGQIGNNHLAAQAVQSNSIASGILGGTQWNPTTAIAGLVVSGVISAGGHVEAASGLWGGQQAPVANVVGELAQALSTGLTYFRATNLAIGSGVGAAFGVYVGSGTGTNKRPVAVFAGLNAVSAGPADPVGIGQIILFDPNVGQVVAHQFGSGGTTAASGYAALSSFIGSGQIGGNHLAAGAVLSANIASGHVGNNHLRLMSGLVISGSLGIGVAPAQILHVAQSNATNVILRIDNMVDTSGTGIQIQMVDGANTFELGGLEVINLSGGGVSELHLRTRIQGSTVRRMSILSGGNIIATSGFGAISSFIRSGTVGGFHLAMPTVSGVYAWGTVAFFNPASGWLSVAPGLSGQRLTTNGSGFDPAWAA